MKEIIAYARVSTVKQGQSGLGLQAQKAAVEAYAASVGARIAALYVEVESGKVADRPELRKALAHARRNKAVLCVAKLDRLSRNLAFLAAVMDSGCEFAAADMPAANRFMLHVMAAVAEHEAKAISDRTKAALQAAKARGTLLGSARPGHWDGREKARQEGARIGAKASAEVRSKAAVDAYADLVPAMEAYNAEGLSLREIAARLNADGHTTRRGKLWNPVQVARVLKQRDDSLRLSIG
jgi:DNA invertase Pin-like site-specific DNA recombinase